MTKKYKKPKLIITKVNHKLLLLNFFLDNLIAGTCPSDCNPPNSCGTPQEPAYCLGNNCAC